MIFAEMGLLRFGLLLAVLGVVFTASIPKHESSDPFVIKFYDLPEDEKENFLTYFLAQGVLNQSRISYPGTRNIGRYPVGLNISQEQMRKFQAMNIPNSSVQNLISWTRRQFELQDPAIATLATRREVCNAQGICVTVPDVGSLCCPW